MPKAAISVTLAEDNLTWLKGRTRAIGARSVSEVLDRIVTEARTGGREAVPSRSVVGTVDISTDDPDLTDSDGVIRDLFEASLERQVLVRDKPATYRTRKPSRPRRG